MAGPDAMPQLLEMRRISAGVTDGAALRGDEVRGTATASVESLPGGARDITLQCSTSSGASIESLVPLPRVSFCCLGALTLLGWNMILAFTHDFQSWGSGWAFWCSICNAVMVNVVQGGMSTPAARERVPFTASYTAGCVLTCVSLLGLVHLKVTTTAGGSVGKVFVAALALVCVQGTSSALLANAVFSLGLGGVFAAAVGFIASGSERGLCISFTLCVFFCVAGIPFYFVRIRRNSHVSARDTQLDSSPQGKSAATGRTSSTELLRKGAYPQCFTVCLVFVVTFVVFPGVASKWRGGHVATQIAAFQLMDVVGRFAPHVELFHLREGVLVTRLALLRGLFVPAFFAVERSRGAFATDFFVQLSLMAAFAFTNGWVSTLSMMLGPGQRGLDVDDAASVGSLMAFFLVLGMLLGSLLGLAAEALLEYTFGAPPGAGHVVGPS